MVPLIKAQGIVLKQINLGEADKIITLFTDKYGKIQVVAHGARKPKSKFISSTQIFSYCEYILFKGKSLYTLNESEVKESFQGLLNDLYTITYCSYMLELIDVLTQQEEGNIRLFLLLLKTLYLMLMKENDREILLITFELKAMCIAGYMPDLYQCTVCKNEKLSDFRFSSIHGGILCEKCTASDLNSIKVDASTINVMRYLIKIDLNRLDTIKISSLVRNEMKIILKNYIKYYLEKDFKSLGFIEDIKKSDNA